MDIHALDDNCFWLLDAVPDATLVVDAEGRIFYSNTLAQELFGYTRDELNGLAVENLLPQRFREAHVRHRQAYGFSSQRRIMGSGGELYGQRKDGSEICVDIALSPIATARGRMSMTTIRDVSLRTQAMQELREREDHLEHVVDSLQDVVWSISSAGDRVLYVNPAWERVFGRSLEELQRNPGLWLDTIHAEDRELAKASLAALLADDHLDLEYRIVRPDGTIRWVSDHAVLVRDAKGEPLRIDGVGRDITRRKEAAERQNMLMHDLKAANEELKNFAYVVSHDLKAPLRAIGSLAEWIATDNADKFDAESREHLRLLIGRVHRMDALIDGILEYSRVGRLHEGRTDIDLERLVHEVVDSLAPPPHIRIEIDTPLPMLNAERTRIQQVFQNLVSNAIKYMDKPEGEVHIGCLDEGAQWKFYVRDTGSGIEKRHFERIFQLFQTLAPRDRVESTGVGLTVVKKIIDMHGGKIWLESEITQGSCFYFTLPKHSASASPKSA